MGSTWADTNKWRVDWVHKLIWLKPSDKRRNVNEISLNYCKIITTKCGKEKMQQHMYSTSKNITIKVDIIINLEDLIINNWRLKKL